MEKIYKRLTYFNISSSKVYKIDSEIDPRIERTPIVYNLSHLLELIRVADSVCYYFFSSTQEVSYCKVYTWQSSIFIERLIQIHINIEQFTINTGLK